MTAAQTTALLILFLSALFFPILFRIQKSGSLRRFLLFSCAVYTSGTGLIFLISLFRGGLSMGIILLCEVLVFILFAGSSLFMRFISRKIEIAAKKGTDEKKER